MSRPHAIVVGAGIGGLAAAIDLSSRGVDVTVFERAEVAGGKMRELEIGDRRIDAGPTVMTMPWIFEELFADAGSRIEDHLELHPADVLARHAWADGGRLDLFADLDRSAEAIAAFAGRAEADRYLAFCRRSKGVFEALYEPFMRSQRPGLLSLVRNAGLRGLPGLSRIHPFETLWHRLEKSFHDPRLRGLFARYATYCGSSPLSAPATLMLIAHVEQRGVWQVGGGMQRLADALASLLERGGSTIRYGSAVREVDLRSGRASGVVLESGEHVAADAVIVNADVAALRRGLLGRDAQEAAGPASEQPRSLSAVTFSMLAETSGFDLAHHNVFFPDDYPQEFRDIFDHGRLPARPAVYACAQDRGPGRGRASSEPKASANRAERLFLITNAPAVGDREAFDEERIEATRTAALELMRRCGLELTAERDACRVTTPSDFDARFPGTGGALYGSAGHGWKASFQRPGSRARAGGLYFAGGSVHPGPGVPMVALSGRLAADAAATDFGWSADR